MAAAMTMRRRLTRTLILAGLAAAPLILAGCADKTSASAAANAGKGATDLTTAQGPDADLLRAAGTGNIFKVRDLLDAGANVNAHTDNGSTPLHGALYYRYPQTAELLIWRGADINARTTPQGVTPLHQAAWSDMPDSCRLLLWRGADPNARTIEGVTPLMWAANRGNADVVKVLLDGGARADIRAPDGATALSLAQDAGHTDVVQVLQAAPATARPAS
ncbi:MAG: ankyrin repeat domain-containing protein [Rhodospirillales bacterium]